MKISKYSLLIFAVWGCVLLPAYNQDSIVIKNLFEEAISSGIAYENLRYLCEHIGPRLCGSPQAAAAVEYTKQILEKMGLDAVFLQDVEVPHWEDGGTEASIVSPICGTTKVNACALGLSIATGDEGIEAEVVEVQTFEEMERLGADFIKGKMVFFNQHMNDRYLNPLRAYSEVSKYRTLGASEAARYGAVAAIVRSLNMTIDEYPHTGGMRCDPSIKIIPAAAICTEHADLLSDLLEKDPHLKFRLKMNCQTLPDALSHNVIGQIKGSEFPDKIIVVGGHLDSWHLGTGAHDDGAGCMQAVEVLRLFQKLGIIPRHTIRTVLYMDEEINQSGGRVYAELAKKNNEKHLAALESDGGGDLPTGFSIDAADAVIAKIQSFRELLIPYGLYRMEKGYGGVDIGPLKAQGVPLIGLTTNLQRYMEYHHSSRDTFDKINPRELEMGAASLASLVYLLDKYGL